MSELTFRANQYRQAIGDPLLVFAAAATFYIVLSVVVAVPARRLESRTTGALIVVIEILRRTPGLVTLYFVYYGFPSAGIPLTGTLAICLAFGLTFVAYTAPILAAIAMVPREHIAVGEALGLSRWTVTTKIVLPQAVRAALPR